MEEAATYNELRLSMIVGILMEKLGRISIELDLKEDVNRETPILMVFDLDDEGSKVKVVQCTREESENLMAAHNSGNGQQ